MYFIVIIHRCLKYGIEGVYMYLEFKSGAADSSHYACDNQHGNGDALLV